MALLLVRSLKLSLLLPLLLMLTLIHRVAHSTMQRPLVSAHTIA